MSADSWAVCPRCLAGAVGKRQAEERRIAALYGQVPVEEFDAQRAALVEVDPEKYRTFREDYEFLGAEEGEIHAKYAGSCKICGLSARLQAVERFWRHEESG